jgi:hypothetical protein
MKILYAVDALDAVRYVIADDDDDFKPPGKSEDSLSELISLHSNSLVKV